MKHLFLIFSFLIAFNCSAQTDSLITVTDNLYMITGLGGNVSFLVTPKGVLLVDAGTVRESGKIISRHIKSVTNLPVKYLVFTQYHLDHTFGACGLDDKPLIISHVNLLKNLERYDEKWLDRNYKAMDHQIMLLKKNLDSLTLINDPSVAVARENYENGLKEVDDFKKSYFIRPDITFNDEFTIYLGSDTIQLTYPKNTHTDCSILVEFTNKKVLAAGDILFNEFFPFIDSWANSNTYNWISTANKIQQENYISIIPGHGKLANSQVVQKQAQYFIDLRSEVKAAMQKGATLEQMQSDIKLPAYSSYGFPDLLKGGIKAIYDELIKENS